MRILRRISHYRFERIILILLLAYMVHIIVSRQFEHYLHTPDPLLRELYEELSTLHPKLANIDVYEGSKSYTINKKRVHICLKDEHGDYYGRNMLTYAILHEFSHVICDEVGHTDKFYRIFDNLLADATERGLYDPSIPRPEKYCGVAS